MQWKNTTRNLKSLLPQSKLFAFLLALGFSVDSAKTLLRLAVLESGNFTSRIYREAGNPWGMNRVLQRPTTQRGYIPSGDGDKGTYKSLWGAAKDMALYFDYFGYNKRAIPTQFFQVYNPSPTYRQAVDQTAVDFGRIYTIYVVVAFPITSLIIQLWKKQF